MRFFNRLILPACFLVFSTSFAIAQLRPTVPGLRRKLQRANTDTGKVSVLLGLSRAYLEKRGELKTDLDSAMLFAVRAGQLGSRINFRKSIGETLLLRGEICREAGKMADAIKFNEQALTYFKANGMIKEQGDAIFARSNLINFDTQPDKKISTIIEAIRCYHQCRAYYEEANTLKVLGDYYQLKGDWPKSVQVLEQSLVIFQRIKFKELQGVYNLLCLTYTKIGQNTKGLRYGLLALKTALALQDSSMQLCTVYNRLALTYDNMKEYDLAINNWEKALKVAEHYKDVNAISTIRYNMVTPLRMLKNYNKALNQMQEIIRQYPLKVKDEKVSVFQQFAQVYIDLKQPDKAKKYMDSLFNYQQSDPYDIRYGQYYTKVGIRYYMELKQYPLVVKQLMISDSILKKAPNLALSRNNQRDWSRADSALGNNVAALMHYKKYKVLSDSTFNQNQKKEIAEMQYEYNLDIKNQRIKLLTKQDQLQKTQIQNEANLRYLFISGLIILLILAALMFNRSRIKILHNQALTLKQKEINDKNIMLENVVEEKEWLLKEIHHRVKNNLQIVISLLNTQSSYLENDNAISAIRNSQQRMFAISLIHQKLYQSDNLSTIDMPNYISELVEYLRECFESEKKIEFIQKLEPLNLDVVQAVPIGLILNEAISNAVKYAFDRSGVITITLSQSSETAYLLCIKDNGQGLPPDFDISGNSSLGMTLMYGLAHQLGAELVLKSEQGVLVCLTFEPSKLC